jgi:hypothetical protein
MPEGEEIATARYIASNVLTQLMLKALFELIGTMMEDPDGCRSDNRHAFDVHVDRIGFDLRVILCEPLHRSGLPRREIFLRPIDHERFRWSLVNWHR